MNDYGLVHKTLFKGFLAVPFLFELKTISDWTFTRTALDIFQWFKLANAHADMFIAKCINKDYMEHKLGESIPKWMKFFLGVCFLAGIILLIAGPLLLFSTFNPIADKNNVTNASMQFNIKLKVGDSDAENTINLFSNNYLTELRQIPTDVYNRLNLGSSLVTKGFDQSLIQ